MPKNPEAVVVYAPPYNENSGGCLVLHLLVHKLRAKGVDAFLCPYHVNDQYFPVFVGPYRRIPRRFRIRSTKILVQNLRVIEESLKRLNRKRVVSQIFDTPIASRSTQRKAVVVYPESIDGNPLRAGNVVRWLLNIPGYINQKACFGEHDELFYFKEAFRGPYQDLPESRFLNVLHVRTDCYFESLRGNVRPIEFCFLVWKGERHGIRASELRKQNKIVIDGLSHEEIGNIFRKSKFLISYTPNSMYNAYAVLCGCVPILQKPPEMNEEEFNLRTKEKLPGIAVGFEDVERAQQTRSKLLEDLKSREKKSDRSLESFIEFLRTRYGLRIRAGETK